MFLNPGNQGKGFGFVRARNLQRSAFDRRKACRGLQKLVSLVDVALGDEQVSDRNARAGVIRA
jgi:hypothetical protein